MAIKYLLLPDGNNEYLVQILAKRSPITQRFENFLLEQDQN